MVVASCSFWVFKLLALVFKSTMIGSIIRFIVCLYHALCFIDFKHLCSNVLENYYFGVKMIFVLLHMEVKFI